MVVEGYPVLSVNRTRRERPTRSDYPPRPDDATHPSELPDPADEDAFFHHMRALRDQRERST
jgi:hypothetical protein